VPYALLHASLALHLTCSRGGSCCDVARMHATQLMHTTGRTSSLLLPVKCTHVAAIPESSSRLHPAATHSTSSSLDVTV
jgi:hypothetical protein